MLANGIGLGTKLHYARFWLLDFALIKNTNVVQKTNVFCIFMHFVMHDTTTVEAVDW